MSLSNAESYRRAFAPRLCDLLPLEVVRDVMRCFFWSTNRGIAFVIHKDDGPSAAESESEGSQPLGLAAWGDYLFWGDEMGGMQNPICKVYGGATDGEGRPGCRKSDAKIFQACQGQPLSEPTVFPCWLGLEESAHCLTIDGRVRAVLISGQQTPAAAPSDKVLAAVAAQVAQKELNPRLAQQLCEKVPDAIAYQQNERTSHDLAKERLDAVTRTLQDLTNRLVRAHRAEAYGKLLGAISDHLAMAADVDPASLWSACEQALRVFCDVTTLTQISVFARTGGRYVRQSPCLAPKEQRYSVKSSTVLEQLQCDRLETLRPNSDSASLWAVFSSHTRHCSVQGSAPPTIRVYRHDTKCPEPFYAPDVEGHFSTVMILVGEGSEAIERELESFCSAISLRLAVAGLSARMLKSREEYNQHVRRVAHAIRTPLQCTYLDLERVAKIPDLGVDIQESRLRLHDASEDLTFLVEESQAKRSAFDLIALLDQVVGALQPLATRHQVTVVRWHDWPTSLPVEANRDAIRRGLLAICENGIKYSYRNKEIRIQAGAHMGSARIVVSNYGIGIPQEMIDALLDGADGLRAEVPDEGSGGRRRQGTGTGVATARDAFRKDGGDLSITSEEKAEARIQEYHRWLTRVTAYLPLQKTEDTQETLGARRTDDAIARNQ